MVHGVVSSLLYLSCSHVGSCYQLSHHDRQPAGADVATNAFAGRGVILPISGVVC